MKRVVIVKEGEWGTLRQARGDYNAWIGLLERAIKDAGDEATVDLIRTFMEAEAEVKKGRVDVLVFISRGMINVAEKIKKAWPALRVVIFSGLPPQEECLTQEIVLVDKADIRGPGDIRRVVLSY